MSNSISLEGLQEKVECVPLHCLQHSIFFHHLCGNKNVSLEMVAYVIDYCPTVVENLRPFLAESGSDYSESTEEWARAYPLHVACSNSKCPNSVIELLLKKDFQSHLEYLSLVKKAPSGWGVQCGHYNGCVVQGLPLHYYLSREENIDIRTVKLLVERYPKGLITAEEESGMSPIHVLLHNPSINNLYEVFDFVVQYDPSPLLWSNGYMGGPLHIACDNKNINAKFVKKLLDVSPEAIREEDCMEAGPIRSLCSNEGLEDAVALEILSLLVEASPVSVVQRDCDGFLPIHHAISSLRPPEFIKILVDACPELPRIESDDMGDLPIHVNKADLIQWSICLKYILKALEYYEPLGTVSNTYCFK